MRNKTIREMAEVMIKRFGTDQILKRLLVEERRTRTLLKKYANYKEKRVVRI